LALELEKGYGGENWDRGQREQLSGSRKQGRDERQNHGEESTPLSLETNRRLWMCMTVAKNSLSLLVYHATIIMYKCNPVSTKIVRAKCE